MFFFRDIHMKYIFGPVNSRRLGLSLGIDLVPHKTCTLDCVYCECGATTELTDELLEYVPTAEVISEIDEYLSSGPELDVITFSGAGEPTLHRDIGEIINHIKNRYPDYKITVLTNGTLLWKKEVRDSLMRVDIIVPSIDSISEKNFNRMLRPYNKITPEKVVDGLVSFSEVFTGIIIIEVFLIPGINDNDEELGRIKEAIEKIRPFKVQLNRLDRPGTEKWVDTIPWNRLVEIKNFLSPLSVEIVGKPAADSSVSLKKNEIAHAVISTLKRRPSTIEDLMQTLGLSMGDIDIILKRLIDKGVVKSEDRERGTFYRAVMDDSQTPVR